MRTLEVPLLVADDDISGASNAFGYRTEVFDAAVDQKVNVGAYRNGIYEAVGLILTEAAVAIQFVDQADPGKPIREGEEPFIRPRMQLGFNDHGGGSESHFRILLNRPDDESSTQYVLYSPPTEDGLPSNLTFHRSDLGFLTYEPSLDYRRPGQVPNALKTGGACSYWGRSNFEFYIVGDSTVPAQFANTFERIGFSFVNKPYDRERLVGIRRNEGNMPSDYPGRFLWPVNQFREQLAKLQELEAA